MERKNLEVSFKRSSVLTEDISKLVAFHNEGSETYSLDDIVGYLKGRRSSFPFVLRNMAIEKLYNELVIKIDGEKIDMTISEKP
jgi:hypothetical protein